ncbi:hypothetical protein J6590_040593 [Homalodisca vitripennis]|nr:hypothetical protein J6590_040593 [Homalodisca vitripennis]
MPLQDIQWTVQMQVEPVLGHRPSRTGLDMSLNCPTVCQTSVPCAVSSHAFSQ